MTALAIFGATGRMGSGLVRAINDDQRFRLLGATVAPGATAVGVDAGTAAGLDPMGIALSDDPASATHGADVAIDFSVAEAVMGNLEACRNASCPLLIGTTGLDEQTAKAIDEAARDIAVLIAPNTSVGINLLCELAARATRLLGEDFDIEVVDIHHRDKRDAPSGTARRLGESIATARGEALSDLAELERLTTAGLRRSGSIGFSAIRAGDIIGDHAVIFAGTGERLELIHRVSNREVFVRGALRAALWLRGRAPGQYSMVDVFEF